MRLFTRADGHGRVPAVEVMIATPFIRDCIINKDKTKLIHEAIAAGVSQYGMQTFDQSIFQLYKKELITYDEALRRASNPEEFKLKIQGIQSTSDMAAEEMERTMQSMDMEEGGPSYRLSGRNTETAISGIPRCAAPRHLDIRGTIRATFPLGSIGDVPRRPTSPPLA